MSAIVKHVNVTSTEPERGEITGEIMRLLESGLLKFGRSFGVTWPDMVLLVL